MIIPAVIALGALIITTSIGVLIRPSITKSDSVLSSTITSQEKSQPTPSPEPVESTIVKFGLTAAGEPPATPTPTPTQSPAATLPSQILNLSSWKLTLPIGSAGKPTEIRQSALSTYQIDPWFIVAPGGGGVRFRAPVNGVTTSGSSYPRSELREMSGGGSTNASWSSTSGSHSMFLDGAITAVPKVKQHVVLGQVHDSSDDIIVIRLEYPNLYVNVDGKNTLTIDSNYTLGKRFTVKFAVSGGKTAVYYNGSSNPTFTLDKAYSGAYFKAGAYTQSNCSKEGSSNCSLENYGEAIIYRLDVTHQS